MRRPRVLGRATGVSDEQLEMRLDDVLDAEQSLRAARHLMVVKVADIDLNGDASKVGARVLPLVLAWQIEKLVDVQLRHVGMS